MTFESLDVVVVPFPFTTDAPRSAVRRWVVSAPGFNSIHEQSILAMITSADNDWPSDVPIRDWREANLNVPCKVRFKFFTLDDALVARKLGTLSNRDGKAVRSALASGLASV